MTKLLTLKKMKKKLVLLTLILIALLLSGCGLFSKHEHDFYYSSDNDNHYLKCDCGETKDREKHNYKWVDGNNHETTHKE